MLKTNHQLNSLIYLFYLEGNILDNINADFLLGQ